MPKLELGDLQTVERYKDDNIAELDKWIAQGWDIVAPIPSCVLMFKQELPLLFPDDEAVQRVARAIFDPFEYLMLRHKDGGLNTRFATSLGKVAYQVPCHLRVQNIGLKTRDVLNLIPDTSVEAIERCSGHDGTYAVKTEFHDIARKIARPVARRVDAAAADHFTSDCPMAADQIASIAESAQPSHPIQLLRKAYGI
jgi:Fe-S oxidoreductase